MPVKTYYLNTARIKNIISEKFCSINNFCVRKGFMASSFGKTLNSGFATEYMARKIADALGVDVSDISSMPKAEKPYWWKSDHEYPVDIEFCKKCWIWNDYSHCCDYLERKGMLRPDNTIVVHENGKNTCSVRELKSKKKPHFTYNGGVKVWE